MKDFAEWKAEVELKYKDRNDKEKVNLSQKEDGNIIGYLDTLCGNTPFLNEIYQEFYKKYEACKKGEKKAGEKTIKMLFIKAIMQDRIVIEKDKKLV